MAFPLTPHTTFVNDSTPSISAAFLNELQAEGVNPAAAAAYWGFPRFSHFCDDAATITILPTQVIVKDSSTSRFTYVNIPETELDVSDLVPSAANFDASTWYYVYCLSTDGVLSFKISATAPDTATQLVYMTGDETRRYLGCFRTDDSGGATGVPVPYRCTRGRYIYDENLACQSSLAATTWTGVNLTSADYGALSTLLPPHSTHPILIVSNNAAYSVQFRPTGTSYSTMARTVAAYAQNVHLEMRCSASQQIDYKVTSGGGSVDFSVGGFEEG